MEKSAELSIPGNASAALAQLAEHASRYVEAGLSGEHGESVCRGLEALRGLVR